MDDRREFLKKIGATAGAFVALASGSSYIKACVNAECLDALWLPEGQTISDIQIGCVGSPRDASYVIEFYKESRPTVPQLSVALNARASYRWVAAPNYDIQLRPGDRLLWRVARLTENWDDLEVAVHTLGLDIATKRVVVNQSEYA